MVLSFTINKLQLRELALDLSLCLTAFKAVNALLVLIAHLKPCNLLDTMRDSVTEGALYHWLGGRQ
jgi:hypothetical protein